MKTLDYIEMASEKEIRDALRVFITEFAGAGVIAKFRKAAGMPSHGNGKFKKKFEAPGKIDVLDGNKVSMKMLDLMMDDPVFMSVKDDIIISAHNLYVNKRTLTIPMAIMYMPESKRNKICPVTGPDKKLKQQVGCLLRIARFRNFSNNKKVDGEIATINEWAPTKFTREWDANERVEYVNFMIDELKRKKNTIKKDAMINKPVADSMIDAII